MADRIEIERQVLRGLKTVAWIFFQTMRNDRVESARHFIRIELWRRRGENGVQRLDHRRTTKGSFARKHLVENRAERKNIGAWIGGFAPYLLGRHIAGGAEDPAGLRVADLLGRLAFRIGDGLFEKLGQ